MLAACGGGGADTTPIAKVTSVKVMGDSLSDSGTYGFKFTVQGSAGTGAGSSAIWPERIATSYGHMSKIFVRAGQQVSAGQTIGAEGQTGDSFGCHVHFEVYVNGAAVDPQPFMRQRGISV